MRAKSPHLPRRRAARIAFAALLTLPLSAAVVAMLHRLRENRQPTIVPVPADVPLGLSVIAGLVVHRSERDGIRAFAGVCTHLGCRIERVVGDEVVCPCHGSRFRSDGSVATGPAARGLKPLVLEPDPATGGWVARVL
jgi:Rieske Fe-S protein